MGNLLYKIDKISNNISGLRGFLCLMTGIAALILSGCSDELDIRNGINIDSWADGHITIELNIADLDRVVTRSDDNQSERNINNLTLFFIDGAGDIIYRHDLSSDEITSLNKDINGTNRNHPYTFEIEPSKYSSGIDVYGVANTVMKEGDLLTGYSEDSGKRLEDLMKIVASKHYDDVQASYGWLMSGKLEGKTLSLIRSTAKVSVSNHVNKLGEGYTKNELFSMTGKDCGFSAYKTADKCYLMAGVKAEPYYTESATQIVNSNYLKDENDNERYEAYILPTKTHSQLENGNVKVSTYVVMKAIYNGQDSYYALPLYDQENKEYLDIKPNHWYDIEIQEVNIQGYPTAEEALSKPMDVEKYAIRYHIYDHTAEVFSMVSDGVRELGVTSVVNFAKADNSGTQDDETAAVAEGEGGRSITDNRATFVVKIYSAINEELKKDDITFGFTDEYADNNWLAIDYDNIMEKDPVLTTGPGEIATPGLQFEVPIYTTREIYSDQKAEIEVLWKGLRRIVTVYYDATIELSTILEVNLTIKGDGNTYYIKNYGTFIEGNGEWPDAECSEKEGCTHESEAPRLFGVQEDELTGNRVRNHGFHFPMPYGEYPTTAPWTYEYNVSFEKIQEVTKYTISKVTPEIRGNVPVVWTPTSTYSGKLTLDSSLGYNYAIGSITYKIDFAEAEAANKSVKVVLDLYHTGFFHFTNNATYGFDGLDAGYYYYEVVPMAGKYWLDRNIGAKSNRYFVDDIDYTSGEKKSRGKFLTIADQANYEGPQLEKTEPLICPPGYHIPSTAEWDPVRMSANFRTDEVTDEKSALAMVTYYATGITNIGKVHFPKARYWNKTGTFDDKYKDFPNSGDAASGYYWTTTEAPGMEKEHMGNWLRTLYMNGETASYINGSVMDHKMLVRCIADPKPDIEQQNYVSFNVHNVTHVFLFYKDTKGNPTPLYTFPGKQVSTAASAINWQYFYFTTTVNPARISMVFVNLDSDGHMHIFTKKGNVFEDSYEVKDENGQEKQININDIMGWSSEDGTECPYWNVNDLTGPDTDPEENSQKIFYYDFCKKALERVSAGVKKSNATHKQPEGEYACDENISTGGGPNKPDPVDNKFNLGDKVILLWNKSWKKEDGFTIDLPYIVSWGYNGGNAMLIRGNDDWDGWRGQYYQSEQHGLVSYTIESFGQDVQNFPYDGLYNFNVKLTERTHDNGDDDFNVTFDIKSINGEFGVYISDTKSEGSYVKREWDSSNNRYIWEIIIYDNLETFGSYDVIDIYWPSNVLSPNNRYYRYCFYINKDGVATKAVTTNVNNNYSASFSPIPGTSEVTIYLTDEDHGEIFESKHFTFFTRDFEKNQMDPYYPDYRWSISLDKNMLLEAQ